MRDRLLHEIINKSKRMIVQYVSLEALKPAFGCYCKEKTCMEDMLFVWAVENRIYFEFKKIGHYKVVRFWGDRRGTVGSAAKGEKGCY